MSRRYTPAKSVQSSYLTLSGCVLLSQGGPGVRLARHRRQRQELRRQRCTARRIGGCDNQCDDNVEQKKKKCACSCLVRMMPPTILSRRFVWCASCTPLYCPGALRPRQACSRLTSRFWVAFYCRRVDLVCVYARRPQRTRRSNDYQRASRKLNVHAVVLCA